jgi:WD40 repeat protein
MSMRPAATRGIRVSALAALLALAAPTTGFAGTPGPWGTAVPETAINSPQADGCPIETFDGLSLYFASTRPGAVGGTTDPNDIWRVSRPAVDAPWGTPVHLPAPVNSASADFCPTPLPGKRLFFVSARAGGCGAGDIYRTREHPVRGWLAPINLGCAAMGSGPNFAGGEFSPSVFEVDGVTYLYFSSPGNDGGTDQDIYVSRQRDDGSFTAPSQVPGLNTASNDQMPNVSRDGLEIVFASDRPGTTGAFDIYSSTRASVDSPWSAPVNVGGGVNTVAAETRPSLSGDGRRLHFGRLGDLWVSTRDR